jgi:Cu-Zn family superoxide dismutase
MTLRHLPFALVLAAGAAAPALAERPPRPLAEARLVDASGKEVGSARFVTGKDGVVLEVTARGLTPGPHGMHLHAVGQCDGPDFTSAGPHLNPDGHEHGDDNPQGSHLGDLPNVTAGRDGVVSAKIRTPLRTFKLMKNVLDGDGTALVLHAGPDDYKTDPTGNSGARVVCGVFERG